MDAALREHPAVFLPEKKQSYFFDRNYEQGLEWYLENFAEAGEEHAVVGEVATGYCLVEAIPRMAQDFGHAKLIMTMRHPVERAYSYFLTRQEQEGWADFRAALDDGDDLKARGRYIEQIEKLLEFYPREQLLLLFYDDLSKDDAGYLRSILEFLGVNAEFESSQIGQTKNAALFPKLRRRLHQVGLKPLLRVLSKSPVGTYVRKAKKKSGKRGYAAMPEEIRAELVEYFRPYNERLSELTGRDLSEWNA